MYHYVYKTLPLGVFQVHIYIVSLPFKFKKSLLISEIRYSLQFIKDHTIPFSNAQSHLIISMRIRSLKSCSSIYWSLSYLSFRRYMYTQYVLSSKFHIFPLPTFRRLLHDTISLELKISGNDYFYVYYLHFVLCI